MIESGSTKIPNHRHRHVIKRWPGAARGGKTLHAAGKPRPQTKPDALPPENRNISRGAGLSSKKRKFSEKGNVRRGQPKSKQKRRGEAHRGEGG